MHSVAYRWRGGAHRTPPSSEGERSHAGCATATDVVPERQTGFVGEVRVVLGRARGLALVALDEEEGASRKLRSQRRGKAEVVFFARIQLSARENRNRELFTPGKPLNPLVQDLCILCAHISLMLRVCVGVDREKLFDGFDGRYGSPYGC